MRLIFFSIILLGISACNKDLDLESFWKCNESQSLDSSAISNKIVGTWRWTKQSCYWTGKTTKADKEIRLVFNGNNSYSVTEGSNTISQGTWQVKKEDTNSWTVEPSVSNEYMRGRILFCRDELLYNHSYIDGCDNLFVRE